MTTKGFRIFLTGISTLAVVIFTIHIVNNDIAEEKEQRRKLKNTRISIVADTLINSTRCKIYKVDSIEFLAIGSKAIVKIK